MLVRPYKGVGKLKCPENGRSDQMCRRLIEAVPFRRFAMAKFDACDSVAFLVADLDPRRFPGTFPILGSLQRNLACRPGWAGCRIACHRWGRPGAGIAHLRWFIGDEGVRGNAAGRRTTGLSRPGACRRASTSGRRKSLCHHRYHPRVGRRRNGGTDDRPVRPPRRRFQLLS
jgi:hypothetical protein